LKNLEGIVKRQNILGEFVKYTETISLNDSLLALSELDTATIRHRFDSLAKKDQKTIATKKKKKKAVSQDNNAHQRHC